jgi:hypothetical protein
MLNIGGKKIGPLVGRTLKEDALGGHGVREFR